MRDWTAPILKSILFVLRLYYKIVYMLNVRLDDETDKELKNLSEQKNVSKSSIVKEALAMYFTKEQYSESPYLLGEELFGVVGSGRSDSSTTYKSKFKQKLNEKYSH